MNGKRSTAPKPPSQAAIARGLGLSKAAITKYKLQGMPISSVEAARAWRDANLRFDGRRVELNPGRPLPQPSPAALVERVRMLALAAADALKAGRFAEVETELRQALRELPNSHASVSLMPVSVWDALTEDIFRLLKEDEQRSGFVEEDREATEEETEVFGDFLLAAARGWVRVVSEDPLCMTYRVR